MLADETDDALTKQVMRSILADEDAQLVVLNGDLISGEATQSSNSSEYLHEVVSPLVEIDQQWASTYGNHDSQANLDPSLDIFEQEAKYPTSLTKSDISGTQAGITNYYLMVYPHDTLDGPPALLLWFFDSRGGRNPSNRNDDIESGVREDWVDESVSLLHQPSWDLQTKIMKVVQWFIEQNANLTSEFGGPIPSLAFYHIPAHAMFEYQDKGVNSTITPGINGETVVSQGSGDTKYTGQDSKFMQALLNTTGLLATFSGHDHENDWCFKWDNRTVDQNITGTNLNMCYGRHTGYGGYSDVARGARQILINQEDLENQLQTWIRLEDGSVSAPVTLNSTYGSDRYGAIFSDKRSQVSGSTSLYEQHYPPFILYFWVAFWMLTQWRQ
ncbi:hypothetical protein N7450_002068 [Penicillium hetheringtonii]|uniref:Calcineurin-like phosphoesterase domain-containing protein n=1 Tax=Penicillium hetheringtonii TaxID=911720 RepID=A0AAD6DVT5_9EURO|nr:hypothetical protein N7450_002068 [Penicillium hetheringtonii]